MPNEVIVCFIIIVVYLIGALFSHFAFIVANFCTADAEFAHSVKWWGFWFGLPGVFMVLGLSIAYRLKRIDANTDLIEADIDLANKRAEEDRISKCSTHPTVKINGNVDTAHQLVERGDCLKDLLN